MREVASQRLRAYRRRIGENPKRVLGNYPRTGQSREAGGKSHMIGNADGLDDFQFELRTPTWSLPQAEGRSPGHSVWADLADGVDLADHNKRTPFWKSGDQCSNVMQIRLALPRRLIA